MKTASEALDLSSPPPPLPPLAAGPPLLTVLPPPPPSPDQAEVLAELEKQQNPRKSWASGLVILGLSLVLFASLGAWHWDARLVLLLVVVLLVHELGHFAAMKVFRYQNVKMFFIPLFGAAVAGVQLRAAGWKKAVVSLMGPLPGICIGAALTLVTIATGNASIGALALAFLLVNGFNLLPVLPLDGGWLLNAVLFCRNRWVEAGFIVAASLGLVLVSIGLQDWLFLVLGIWMLLTVPHTFRISTLAERLRAKASPQDGEADRRISQPCALAILEEVKADLPAKVVLKPKTLAQFVMSVYEKRHATAPGLWASLGLLAAYGGSLFIALLFTSLLVVHRMESKAAEDPMFPTPSEAVLSGEPPSPAASPAR